MNVARTFGPLLSIAHDSPPGPESDLTVAALSLPEFIARWCDTALSEKSAAQSHFIDLCDVLGQPRPAAADWVGTSYACSDSFHCKP
jgi:hypothetical protein